MGQRHYFACGGVILAVLDVSHGGLEPTLGPKSLFFAVHDVDAVPERASRLGVLAPYEVHVEPAGQVVKRPWGEQSPPPWLPRHRPVLFVLEGGAVRTRRAW